MARQYGFSMASLLPFSATPFGLSYSFWLARQTKLLLQLVPLRGLQSKQLSRMPAELVLSYEGPWRDPPIGLYEALMRDRDALLGWVAFGSNVDAIHLRLSRMAQCFPEALPIDIPGGALETSPANGDNLDAFLENEQGFVIDTWHIRDFFRCDEDMFKFLLKVANHPGLRMIHVQTRNSREFEAYITRSEATVLELQLKRLANISARVPVILELMPWQLYRGATRTLCTTKQHVSDCLS